MSEEENMPEGTPESINPKPSETSVNPLLQGSVEPNISPAPSPLPSEEKDKTETNETSTLSPPPQPSTMEVHHHGHVHEQKKWKEYFFQFLMLFLAVTAGFFIENQREHYVNANGQKNLLLLCTTKL